MWDNALQHFLWNNSFQSGLKKNKQSNTNDLFSVYMLSVCRCDFLKFSVMKPSEVLTVHQKRSYKNFKHENVRVIEGVSLFFFFLSFRWSDNVPETWVVNLENQSDKFYRISRPKKTQRISPSALLLRSGCVIQYRKKPALPVFLSGRAD